MFRMAPTEAAVLDPQQRILLEETLLAMEDSVGSTGSQLNLAAGEAGSKPFCVVCNVQLSFQRPNA